TGFVPGFRGVTCPRAVRPVADSIVEASPLCPAMALDPIPPSTRTCRICGVGRGARHAGHGAVSVEGGARLVHSHRRHGGSGSRVTTRGNGLETSPKRLAPVIAKVRRHAQKAAASYLRGSAGDPLQ